MQAELKPWCDAFEQVHNRRPHAADAAATGVPDLAQRFSDYELLRERLMAGIPIMRDSMTAAEASRQDEPMNSNQGALSKTEASVRVQAALAYKKRRRAACLLYTSPSPRD